MARVGVIGIGHGRFGRRSDATVQELAFEAFRLAVRDAGIEPQEIDASVVAAVPEYHKQRSVAGVVHGALALERASIIQLGVLLLIATPVARVAFSVLAFAAQRDAIYVTVTLVVLAVLLYSLFLG